jgi:hypothetical protein
MTVGSLLTMCHQGAGHYCHRALIAIGMPWPIVTNSGVVMGAICGRRYLLFPYWI